MTNSEELRADIAYVRAATDRSDARTIPAIYLLWAVIGLCGFALVDFVDDHHWIGRYWVAAAPIGFCLSVWLGIRASRHAGQADRRTGIRWSLHWLAFLVAGALGGALVAAGYLEWPGFGSLWVLLLGLSYFQAGLHLDRRCLLIGGVLAASFVVTLFVPSYAWTVAGVMMAAALTWQAVLGARTSDAAN